MHGPAGEFYSVTWPGFVGVLTAMAPGRFAAAINQAPLRRRTHIPGCGFTTCRQCRRHAGRCVPSRRTSCCARCWRRARDFAQAQALLETTPIARPVIYTLAGCGRASAA